jgi:acyl dehydratase
VHVDDDQTFRYRDASGDTMPIHVDDAFAKSVGLPGIIAHGLCTMAMTSQAVVKLGADGDPSRLRRLAVRFAGNVFPGDDVTTTVYDAGTADGRRVYAFEATSRGDRVITHGRADVGA